MISPRLSAAAVLLPLLTLTACGSSSSSKVAAVSAVSGNPAAVVSSPAASGASTQAPSTTEATSPTAASGKAPNPCSLLSVADVTAIAGTAMGPGSELDGVAPLGGKLCDWSATNTDKVAELQVVIKGDADITAPGETASSLFAEDTAGVEGMVAASGIGDKAFFSPTRGYTLAKGYLISTSVDIGGQADSSSQDKALAKAVVAKL